MDARCACGAVVLEATGPAIACAVCYCADCQEGSRAIEALEHAGPVRDPDGGTAYVLFRKDRYRYLQGSHLLADRKIREASATARVLATCCNSAILMRFDDARHWVSVYRARCQGAAPSVEMRICTRYRSSDTELPGDVPSSPMYPVALMARLLTSRIAMAFRM
jgi:hypothetical protein